MATEKRLIDANKLITTIQGTESKVAMNAPYDAEWFSRMADRQFEIIEMIDKAPAVDAVEVVHGRWIVKEHSAPYGGFHLFHCSECDSPNAQERNYCPNCGADMR